MGAENTLINAPARNRGFCSAHADGPRAEEPSTSKHTSYFFCFSMWEPAEQMPRVEIDWSLAKPGCFCHLGSIEALKSQPKPNRKGQALTAEQIGNLGREARLDIFGVSTM